MFSTGQILRWLMMTGAVVVLFVSCAGSTTLSPTEDDASQGAGAAVLDGSMAAPAESPTSPLPTQVPTARPAATSTPDPTATPEPTLIPPTPAPSPTPADTTPIVIAGDVWAVTEADVDRLVDFIETTHDLAFRSPVIVETSTDIGADFAQDLDIFADNDWRLLNALGLIDEGFDRDAVNQLRRDRIRGLCCRGEGDELSVIVEARATKLETEVILVHELVHALHRQYPEIIAGPGRSGGFELPDTYNGTFEAIAQLVAFAYLDTQPADVQAEVEPELLIVDDELGALTGRVPGEMLNFAYFTAPSLAQVVFDLRGPQGLSDLLGSPPTTTEQIVYPERWLAGEDRVSQDPPAVPAGAIFVTEGRVGVAVLGWLLDEIADRPEVDAVLAQWTGDRYTLYEFDGRDCVSMTVELDEAAAAEELGAGLSAVFGVEIVPDDERRVRVDTCAIADAQT